MSFTVLTFLFMLQASAFEVPHWVQQESPSLKSAQFLQELMVPFRSLQSKMQTPNSRRLQAIMSDECNAACPGLKAWVEEVAKPAYASMSEAEKATLNCGHMDAVVCMSNKACQDPKPAGTKELTAEETKEQNDNFKCACTCKSEIAMMADDKKNCVNPGKDAIKKCFSDNSFCAPFLKMVGGTRGYDISCEMTELECTKLGGKLPTCVGATKWKSFDDCAIKANDAKLADHKDKCCPLLTTVIGCTKKKCITLGWEMQEIGLNNLKGAEKTKAMKTVKGNYQWGSVCTDAALPASKDALLSQGGGAAAADDASHAVPVLGVASMLIAASF